MTQIRHSQPSLHTWGNRLPRVVRLRLQLHAHGRYRAAHLFSAGLLLGCAWCPVVLAGQPLFDAHLHYTAEDAARYAPGQIIDILRTSDVARAVVTSSPPDRVLALHAQAPQRIVPLLGVYRSAADKENWHADTTLPARLASDLAQGPWRGVGELHLFAAQRRSPVFLRVVELATSRGLPLLMHCDPAVIDALFEHAPQATVIWAHAGAYPYPPLLADYLQRHPRLYVDLSVRDDRIAPGGVLDDQWGTLLMEHADRFLVGVDSYRTERWDDYGLVAAQIRGWLAQLPAPVREQLAVGNAQRLFGTAGDPIN